MSDDVKDIVIPILRTLQADMGMVKESIRRIDARMGAMSSYMAGFHSSLSWLEDEHHILKGRLEALEKPPTPPAD